MTRITNVVTESYQYPELIIEVIDRLNATPTDQIVGGVTSYDDENGTKLVLAHPEATGSFDEALEASETALVFDFPFANGDFPWKRVQAQFLSELTGKPVIGIASPGTDGSKYKFSREEKQSIANDGDFRPYSERGLQAIDSAFDIGRLSFIGWSQGGSVSLNRALVARGNFDVESVVSGDPTSAEDRGLVELFSDLSAAGYDKLKLELEDGGLKALIETLGYGEENGKSDLFRTLHYGKSVVSATAENLLLAKGLRIKNLSDVLIRLTTRDIRTVVGYGADSQITKHAEIEKGLTFVNSYFEHNDIQWTKSGLQVVKFEGTTHAGGDNVKKLGLLALAGNGRPIFG